MNPLNLIGCTLGGRYTLGALLGVGGFGAVYRAVQHPLDRVVAVKVLLHASADQRARFEREAQILAALRHPRCVTLHDFGIHEGALFLVTEFIGGVPLDEWVPAGHRVPLADAVRWVDGILDALAAAHRVGIVHRDVKPANVMRVEAEGEDDVRVLDFGIARPEDEAAALTVTGQALGTPRYMAPEQALGGRVSPATDVYAAGVLLYRLLAGREPFVGATAFEVMRAQIEAPPPPLSGEVPAAVARVVMQALAKQPGDRFADAYAMRRALAAAVGGAGEVARSPTDAAMLPANPSRRLARGVAAMGVLALALAVGAWALWRSGSSGDRRVVDAVEYARAARSANVEQADAGGATESLVVRDLGLAAGSPQQPDPVADAADERSYLPQPGDVASAIAPDVQGGTRSSRDGVPETRRRGAAAARFERALAVCDCTGAAQTLASVEGADAQRWRRRYEMRCVALLPSACPVALIDLGSKAEIR